MHKIETQFQIAQWLAAAKIKRSFVKHANPEASPGNVWNCVTDNTPIKLSVIIPTIDANRGGYFLQLLSQIGYQDFKGFEVIVICGDPRQGRTINIGAALALGRYILTLDDDTSLPDPMTFGKLVAVMEKHPEIGIAGGNNVIPKDASHFVRHLM